MPSLSHEEIDEELLEKTKAYLHCRSRRKDPSPELVDAWERFYCALGPRIRSEFAKWRLPNADSEDCLQDVWEEVIAHLGQFQHDPYRGRVSTWLTTVARNKAADSIRRRTRHPCQPLDVVDVVAIPDPAPGPVAECERRWTQSRVSGLLDALANQVSNRSFRVLYLRWIEGHTVAEIANALSLTPEQVRLRAHRMKRRFRVLFECSVARESDRPEISPELYVWSDIS